MKRHFKRFKAQLELPDGAPEGSFRAVFSTLNVVDHDGDVTQPGAFDAGAPVRIAAWGHNWGLPTIGKGTIDADDSAAWVDGQFNLAMTMGRDTYESVKFNGALQEWSYGFEILERSDGQFDGRPVQFLKRVNVFEVSPVLLGAGIGTHTEAIKALAKELLDGDPAGDPPGEPTLMELLERLGAAAAAAEPAEALEAAEKLAALVPELQARGAPPPSDPQGTPLVVLRAQLRAAMSPALRLEGVSR